MLECQTVSGVLLVSGMEEHWRASMALALHSVAKAVLFCADCISAPFFRSSAGTQVHRSHQKSR